MKSGISIETIAQMEKTLSTTVIHKVLSPCDAYACCGATACNWNKTVKWEECNCEDCLKFKRRIKEKKQKENKVW